MPELDWIQVTPGIDTSIYVPVSEVNGTDGPVIAGVLEGNDFTPGVYDPKTRTCVVKDDGTREEEFYVLKRSPYVQYEWVSEKYGHIPVGAIQCGTSSDQMPLYVGRFKCDGRILCGKVGENIGGCQIRILGQKHFASHYEALCLKSLPFGLHNRSPAMKILSATGLVRTNDDDLNQNTVANEVQNISLTDTGSEDEGIAKTSTNQSILSSTFKPIPRIDHPLATRTMTSFQSSSTTIRTPNKCWTLSEGDEDCSPIVLRSNKVLSPAPKRKLYGNLNANDSDVVVLDDQNDENMADTIDEEVNVADETNKDMVDETSEEHIADETNEDNAVIDTTNGGETNVEEDAASETSDYDYPDELANYVCALEEQSGNEPDENDVDDNSEDKNVEIVINRTESNGICLNESCDNENSTFDESSTKEITEPLVPHSTPLSAFKMVPGIKCDLATRITTSFQKSTTTVRSPSVKRSHDDSSMYFTPTILRSNKVLGSPAEIPIMLRSNKIVPPPTNTNMSDDEVDSGQENEEVQSTPNGKEIPASALNGNIHTTPKNKEKPTQRWKRKGPRLVRSASKIAQ